MAACSLLRRLELVGCATVKIGEGLPRSCVARKIARDPIWNLSASAPQGNDFSSAFEPSGCRKGSQGSVATADATQVGRIDGSG